ncbi:MAG: hypothetical protein JSV65_02975 [Armatimonadota bacterium]|nr:MAG: hypothetical protein JSV65_02975 [Armatimonadota bacterium]
MAYATTRILISLALAAALAALAAPALGQEMQLVGMSLGDTPEELLAHEDYGPPDAMFTPGNVFNSVKTTPGEVPPWAIAVRMAQVGPDQVQWVYNRDPVAIGLLITGEGINAHVTNIVVSMWRDFKPSKIAETEKGIRLGSSFAEVFERYGWPNRMQIIAEAGTTEPQQAGTARAARPAAPGAGRPGALGGLQLRLGGGRDGGGSAAPAAARPRPTIGSSGVGPRLPAPRAAARPRAASGGLSLRLGGGRGEDRGTGPGPLPRVGRAPTTAPARVAVPTGPTTSTAAAVGQVPNVTFTKSCILSYPTVDFVVYRMTVFRIHIYGR